MSGRAPTRRLAVSLLLAGALAACGDPRIKANLAAANAFLAQNARQPGVVSLPSGLQYRVLRSGPAGGVSPSASDQVSVQYEGRLLNGQLFDSSAAHGGPASFEVGHLIPAWTQALQMMKPGDAWMLYAPPDLAYGEKGAGPIPPNSALIFKIELIAILPYDASVGQG